MNSTTCNKCGNINSLDNLIQQENKKGNYVCKPCITDELNEEYDPFMTENFNHTPIKQGRIQKLIGWCFG